MNVQVRHEARPRHRKRHRKQGIGRTRTARRIREARALRRADAAEEIGTPTLRLGAVVRRFWPYTRGQRLMLALGTVLTVVAIPLDAVTIWLFKILVDDVLAPADFGAFPRLAASYLALTVGLGVLELVTRQVLARVGGTFLRDVRARVFAHLHTLSMEFFERRSLGDLLSRLNGDVAAIEALVLTGVTTAVDCGLRVVVYGAMLFVVDPLLAACALVITPLLWLVGRAFARRMKAASRQSRHRLGALTSVAEESLSAVGLVQAYNRQEHEQRRFEADADAVLRAAMRSSLLRGLYAPLTELVELVGVLLVLAVGTWQLAQGRLTLGELLVFVAYFAQMSSPLRGLGSLGNSLFTASAGAERVAEVLDAQPGIVDGTEPLAISGPVPVAFEHVTFTYPGADRPALRDVSFEAWPGELVAIVGPSGSGKSTLAKLLLRFYDPDPDSGAVRLAGRDLREVKVRDVRENVAAVLQDTLVMSGTVAENVLWGRPDADDDGLAAAARAADLDTVLAGLPDGADTQVGYRGRRLSGGQRQRVALARAMIRDAPVLLLDEPSTGLDAVAERRVLAPLLRLAQGRTAIVVSHNLLSVRAADLIVVLDEGQVVETGTHTQLLARRGHYHRLYCAARADGRGAHPDEPSDAELARAELIRAELVGA